MVVGGGGGGGGVVAVVVVVEGSAQVVSIVILWRIGTYVMVPPSMLFHTWEVQKTWCRAQMYASRADSGA